MFKLRKCISYLLFNSTDKVKQKVARKVKLYVQKNVRLDLLQLDTDRTKYTTSNVIVNYFNYDIFGKIK
jgi:hypothetical protein